MISFPTQKLSTLPVAMTGGVGVFAEDEYAYNQDARAEESGVEAQAEKTVNPNSGQKRSATCAELDGGARRVASGFESDDAAANFKRMLGLAGVTLTEQQAASIAEHTGSQAFLGGNPNPVGVASRDPRLAAPPPAGVVTPVQPLMGYASTGYGMAQQGAAPACGSGGMPSNGTFDPPPNDSQFSLNSSGATSLEIMCALRNVNKLSPAQAQLSEVMHVDQGLIVDQGKRVTSWLSYPRMQQFWFLMYSYPPP